MNVFHETVRSLARLLRRLRRGVRPRGLTGHPQCDGTILPGRERLIQRVLSTIHNNSILLLGEPGIGKTSVLLELGQRLSEIENSEHDFFPVYIDLHHVPERLLFAAVADAVLRQLSQSSPPRRVNGTAPHRAGYDHRDLANDVRSVIRALGQNNPKPIRLVLLVDGIDEVNNYDPRTAQKVRSLFMAGFSEYLVMVASAVEIDKRWEQEGSPWFNFFEEIELHHIDGDNGNQSDVRDTMTQHE
jgi:Cdc6-like AAA superfamily ATPase